MNILTLSHLHELWDDGPHSGLDFDGHCMDCGQRLTITVDADEEQQAFVVRGGAVYETSAAEKTFCLKCEQCHKRAPVALYQKCEVYDRVVGYLRPVQNWNPGKQAEHRMRKRTGIEGLKEMIR